MIDGFFLIFLKDCILLRLMVGEDYIKSGGKWVTFPEEGETYTIHNVELLGSFEEGQPDNNVEVRDVLWCVIF